MARNGSGTMSVVNTFVSGTVITAADHNGNMTDIAAELTNSVAADGQTTMTAPLKHSAGTAPLPSMTFSGATTTGFFKSTNGIGVAVGGTQIGELRRVGPFLPVGVIMDYAANTTPPSGWLLCYGQSILRATYADLFGVLGTFYGAADGTHFNIPDCRGLVIAGYDDMGGTARNALTGGSFGSGASFIGASSQTILQANLPAVNFVNSGITVADTRTWQGTGFFGAASGGINSVTGANPFPVGDVRTTTVTTTGGALSVSAQGTAASGGSGTALTTIQPTIALSKIIYTGVA